MKNNQYSIIEGNNSQLIEKILKNRRYWFKSDNFQDCNFFWHPTSSGFKFEKLKNNFSNKNCFNHFEFHQELSTKSQLLQNCSEYCFVN